MFWNKKGDSNPLGVPLGDLVRALDPTTIKASLQGNTLVARHEHYTTLIEVVPPENRESEDGPIRAVVRLTTRLPQVFSALFKKPGATVPMNTFAALGALSWDREGVYIGSRLTIYEAEDAWNTLHLPLLLFTTIAGTEAILGAIRRALAEEDHRGGASEWTEADFAQVESSLSRGCLCTTGGLGLTAEFGLSEGAITAADGHKTALFQLEGDAPHPELGGGLFCLLQMPHHITDEEHMAQICVQLNSMEMAAGDLSPHFGAWCKGKLDHTLAYVSFFPNALHGVPGIALNAACWAANRARWADRVLASLGVGA